MRKLNIVVGGIFLMLFATSQLPAAPQISTAPVNPEFTAWQTKVEMSGLESYDPNGYPLGHIPSPVDRSHLQSQTQTPLEALEGAPSSYDLRSSGHVTAVRDQGGCGSCWSFATYGSLESWLLKNEAENRDFSENHLKNYHGFDWGPCDGGNDDISTAYMARWAGPIDESDDPYHDWDDYPSPGGPCQKYFKRTLWFFTDSDIKNALMTHGAMYVTMYWESGSYNAPGYTYYYSGSEVINHAVTLIGWDDNKPVSGAPGNGAWLIKNSWGTGWGDNGYFWISYYDTKAVTSATAFCDAVPTSTYSTNYQYDPLGLTAAFGFSSSIGWAANIFTATANEKLQAVAFYAVDDNISYQIYIYDNFSGSSFSTLLGSTSGTLSNAGYHTIALPSAIDLTGGDDFAIVVKFTTTGFDYPIPLEMDFPGYSSGATASPGQSYMSDTGATFADITSFGGLENTNVCIKGLTVPPVPVAPVITSSPLLTITAGQLYSYNVDATGIPAPVYSLTTLPAGMTINSSTGLIQWTPLASQIGTADVVVEADNVAGSDSQSFTITVSGVAPTITSSPVESAKTGWLYSYDVDATGIPAPVYSLTTSPAGMTINSSTGLIQWTPLVSQIGTANVVVEADNSEGSDTQSFTITVSPSNLYNVKDYGALGDGMALDSPAVNDAIEDANAHGGGTVYFPPGTYICGSIRLKSDIRLDLDSNAVIEAAPNWWGVFDIVDDNPYQGYKGGYHDWGHNHWKSALIWGIGLENVAITGEGLINGQTMTAGVPSSGNGDRTISLKECTGVLIEDINIYRGGHFAIILTGCDNVVVNNVLIDTNRDATNFDCCKNVSITNCLINSPGDDAICLKSSYALGYKRSTENVNIENCTVMAYDIGTLFPQFPNQSKPVRHGRIKFGTESNGGFKNINITNCHFEFCYGFMLATVDGGDIENINISDITMHNVIGVPIFIKLGNRASGPGPPPPGIVRNINIDNVTGNYIDRRFCNAISGIPGHYIEDVNMSNIDLQAEGGYSWEHSLIELDENEAGHPDFGMLGDWYPSYGFYCRHVKNIQFHDVNIGFYYDDERPALICIDVNGLELDNFNAQRSYGNKAPVIFEDIDNIDIHDCNDIEWIPSTYGSIWSSANKVITGEPFDISVEANSISSGVSTTQMYIDSNYVDTEYVWLNADEWKDIVFKDNYLYTPGLHKVEIEDSVFYQGVCLPSDFNFDYRVDFADYAQLADDWLRQASIATTSQEPVAWWKFDEGTGYFAYDSSLYHNTGSLINMSQSKWVSPGRFGGALRFDGYNDYVYMPDHPSLNFGTNSFTFSAWLKTTQSGSTGYLIINGTSGGGYSGKRYSLRHKNSTLIFAIDDGSSKSTASSNGAVINDGQWHHIAAIRDRQYWQHDSSEGRTKGLNIFFDGNLVGNGSDYTGDISSPGEPVFIGRDGIDFYGYFMNGTMDDIRLYNYALLKADIATLLDVIYLPLTSNLYDAGDGMVDGLDLSILMDDWLSCADDLPGDLENEGNFEVTYYKANVVVGDLLDAIDVYLQDAATAVGEVNVINLRNTGAGGHYAEDKPFPGTVMGVNVDDFVIAVEGTIDIPHSGQWTFGVNSDEGFYLEIDDGLYTSYHLYNRSPADTFMAFDLPAGEHSLFMLFWDNTQGSELELFAAPGVFSVFDAKEFALVGDLLNGQISVVDSGP